jgi:phosphatidylglycerol lysyltransferase
MVAKLPQEHFEQKGTMGIPLSGQANVPRHLSRILTPQRQRWLLATLVATITFGSGLLNLFSVMGGPRHPKILGDFFPLEFIRLSRTFTLLIGFALVTSSLNIFARKRRAWMIVLGLSSFSIVFHLTRGLDYWEATLSLVLVIVLLLTRKTFSVKSSAPDLRWGLVRLATAVGLVLLYGVAGFWLLDERHFGINFHIEDSIHSALRVLSFGGDARLVPRTPYGRWFLDSLYIIAGTGIVYAGFAIFRPVIYRLGTLPRERALARSIADQFGRTTLDYFKLWPDKSYFFTPSHRCFLAYGVGGNSAVVLGDPVGPLSEVELAIPAFLEFCRDNGWCVGFHQTLPDFLPLYQQSRMKKLKIGDDAIVDLKDFTLEGKSKKEFRYKVRQLEGMGIHTVEYRPPVPAKVIRELRDVSDEWLRIPGRRERTFTLGQFTENYIRSTPVIAALDKDETILAFVNLIAMWSLKELTIDLMRRRREAPNGIMDYLFVKLLLYAKEHGYERFNLGMAPMAGFQEHEEATKEERAIHSFFQQLNFLFSYRGLRQYKAKFASSWEPRYLIYANALELPRLALALRRVSEIRDGESIKAQESVA